MGKASTGIKLGIAFGLLIALLIGVGWLGLSRMGQINAGVSEILDQRWTKIQLGNQALNYSNSSYRMTLAFALMKHAGQADINWFPPRHAEMQERISLNLAKIEQMSNSAAEKELLAKIHDAIGPADRSVTKLVATLRAQGKKEQATALLADEAIPAMNQDRDAWVAFLHYEQDQILQAKNRNEANYAATRRLFILLSLLAIAAAVGIAALVTRRFSQDITDREEGKTAIRRLNEDLEKSVAERTEELARTVETLKGEVIEGREKEADLRRLAAIVEGSDDAIIGCTFGGLVTAWNAGAERMFGYSQSEIIGKALSQIVPADRFHEFVDSQARLLKGETCVRSESVRLRKDGKPVQVAMAVSPIQDEDGRVIGGSGILRDITDRKFMEDALRRSEASYRSFVENAPYGILRTTPDGRIVQANPALVEMLGYDSVQEVLNLRMDADVYLHGEERKEATLWVRKQDSVQGIEVDWKHKSGRPFTIRCAAHVVKDRNGKVEFLEGFIEDISERRAMEMQLRQGQKMEAIGRLAGGIAHDFNNLLGVIIGYGDVVAEQVGRNSRLHDPVEQIRKAANRASALTRQLLAFSRQQVLEMRVLDLNAVVGEMQKMLPRLLGEDIRLETTLDPGLGSVKADQGQIEQVIMNLAVNARDAMPGGGRLLIKTANVFSEREIVLKQSTMAAGEYVMLSVKDTGTGMDQQTQAHIFEPFFTTKEAGKGTGLGLATVYGFVKQSGGYIWVDSEPGSGSTFTIYLPRVADERIPRHSAPAASASRQGAETILLAEDEESLRTLTRNLLVESGYTVLEAGNGSEALEVAREHTGPIHLLLSDMVMPGMSGHATAEKLAGIRPEIRVLYMSGYSGFNANGPADPDMVIIAKPFTRDQLLTKLRETLDVAEKAERI